MTLSRWMPRFTSLLLLVLVTSCASDDHGGGLSLAPETPEVKVEGQLVLSLASQEELASDPAWEIQELHGGGFRCSTGFQVTYLAPPSAGTYHVAVQASRHGGSRVRNVFEVNVLPDPKVEPAWVRLAPGKTQSFTARMKGLPRHTVIWSLETPDSGEINPEGIYTAPAQRGTYRVIATSTTHPDVSATATVSVE